LATELPKLPTCKLCHEKSWRAAATTVRRRIVFVCCYTIARKAECGGAWLIQLKKDDFHCTVQSLLQGELKPKQQNNVMTAHIHGIAIATQDRILTSCRDQKTAWRQSKNNVRRNLNLIYPTLVLAEYAHVIHCYLMTDVSVDGRETPLLVLALYYFS
jgi:hypothetical protein